MSAKNMALPLGHTSNYQCRVCPWCAPVSLTCSLRSLSEIQTFQPVSPAAAQSVEKIDTQRQSLLTYPRRARRTHRSHDLLPDPSLGCFSSPLAFVSSGRHRYGWRCRRGITQYARPGKSTWMQGVPAAAFISLYTGRDRCSIAYFSSRSSAWVL